MPGALNPFKGALDPLLRSPKSLLKEPEVPTVLVLAGLSPEVRRRQGVEVRAAAEAPRAWASGFKCGTWGFLESQWLIIMGYFKPIMVYFGV